MGAKLLIAFYVITTSLALITLKLGSAAGAPVQYLHDKIHFNITLYTVMGIILYGTSFLLYMFLISKYDLGYIIPLVTAFVYVVIFIASYFIFKEVFTIFKILGICLILGGIALLNVK